MPNETGDGSSMARMQVVAFTMDHRGAPLAVRERVAFAPDQVPAALDALRTRVSEAFILSTCNRVEVYAVAPTASAGQAAIQDLLRTQRGVTRAESLAFANRLDHHGAVVHLHRVAAGLESLVRGEREVIAQLRRALAIARASGALGPVLERLGASAVNCGRRVRRARYASGNWRQGSVATLAIDAAERAGGSLRGRCAVVIGAGEAARGVCSALAERGVGELVVVNRTAHRARELARQHRGTVRAWEQRVHAIGRADAVFVCVATDEHVIDREALRVLRNQSGERRLACVDLSVPRAIEPRIASLPGVTLLDIDDLRSDAAVLGPAATGESAHDIGEVRFAVQRFDEWWHARSVVPLVAELRQNAESLCESEVARALARLPELSERERFVVRGLARRMMNGLLHAPTMALKAGRADDDLACAAQRLFDLREGLDHPILSDTCSARRVAERATVGL